MKTLTKALLLTLLSLLAAPSLQAQRRVTPVTPAEPGLVKSKRPDVLDRTHVVEQKDVNGNVVLVDTLSGREVADTALLAPPPPMLYPLIQDVTVGFNFWDPLMRALGQKYGLGDVWAELSMHNRYFPFVAFGFGSMHDTPADNNFTFDVPASPYIKIGGSYNFLYNSNPDYRLQMGLRYGFSSFKWNVEDVTVNEGYWDDPGHFSIRNRKCTAGYLDVTFGVRVKIFGNFSAGWNIVYHAILHETKDPVGQPMYIPGYGKRSSAVTGNFSITYTIPINKKRPDEVNTSEGELSPDGDDTP